MMPREFDTIPDLITWAQSLDDRWPERRTVMQHISQQLQRVPFLHPNVVELCCGAGALSEFLLRESPRLTYRGIDNSASLITFTKNRLTPFENRIANLHQTDLNTNNWPPLLPDPIHAIISMQSLHDLGNETHVNRIYGLSKNILTRGGIFLNADLITPEKPGRLPIKRHLELLQSHGYDHVSCTLEIGAFACVVGFKGPVDLIPQKDRF